MGNIISFGSAPSSEDYKAQQFVVPTGLSVIKDKVLTLINGALSECKNLCAPLIIDSTMSYSAQDVLCLNSNQIIVTFNDSNSTTYVKAFTYSLANRALTSGTKVATPSTGPSKLIKVDDTRFIHVTLKYINPTHVVVATLYSVSANKAITQLYSITGAAEPSGSYYGIEAIPTLVGNNAIIGTYAATRGIYSIYVDKSANTLSIGSKVTYSTSGGTTLNIQLKKISDTKALLLDSSYTGSSGYTYYINATVFTLSGTNAGYFSTVVNLDTLSSSADKSIVYGSSYVCGDLLFYNYRKYDGRTGIKCYSISSNFQTLICSLVDNTTSSYYWDEMIIDNIFMCKNCIVILSQTGGMEVQPSKFDGISTSQGFKYDKFYSDLLVYCIGTTLYVGRISKYDGQRTSYGNVCGIALNNGNSGSTVVIALKGIITTNMALTPGEYYGPDANSMLSTAYSIPIGKAIGTNTLLLI